MTIKGLLFDKDGTLLEFHNMWLKVARDVTAQVMDSYRDAVRARGLGENQLLEAIGVYGQRIDNHGLLASNPVEDTAAAWHTMISPACSPAAFTREVKTLFDRVVEENPHWIEALPGIEQQLINLKQRGFKLGVATADTRDATLFSLRQAGLIHLFDHIGFSDGTIDPKPAPALLDASCQACGLIRGEVVMFGDTVSDMRFGRENGARSVGVLTGSGTEDELAPHATLVLPSVAAFDPGRLPVA